MAKTTITTMIIPGMTLPEYTQIEFMKAVLSNPETMKTLWDGWVETYKGKTERPSFESIVFDHAKFYTLAFITKREGLKP